MVLPFIFNFNNINSDVILIVFLAIVNCISLILCICSPNPILSLLFLILSFFNVSLMFMVIGLEFLSLLILLVYVGAICILFIFVLMMLDIRILVLKSLIHYRTLIVDISVAFLLLWVFIRSGLKSRTLTYFNNSTYFEWSQTFFELSDMETLGYTIFTNYVPHFIIVTIILFVVLIASISIVIKSEKALLEKKHDPYFMNSPSKYLMYDYNKMSILKNNFSSY